MVELLAPLFLLGLAIWLWRDSLRAREAAITVCKRACTAEQVQLLDDTVALTAIWPQFYRGRLALRRVYGFEFSRAGVDRSAGSIIMLGGTLVALHMTPSTSQS